MRICPHRGFPVEDSGGVCPYHGLRMNGCFYFKAKTEWVSPYDPSLLDLCLKDCGELFAVVRQEVKAPWHLWMQNTADFHHVKTTHPKFSKILVGAPFDVRISGDDRNSSHRIWVENEVVKRYRRLAGDGISEDFLHILRYPGYSITSFLGVTYSIERAHPAPMGCFVTTKFYKSVRNPLPKPIYAAVEEANRKLLAEDKELVEKWAQGEPSVGNWINYEARVRAFCNCLHAEGIA